MALGLTSRKRASSPAARPVRESSWFGADWERVSSMRERFKSDEPDLKALGRPYLCRSPPRRQGPHLQSLHPRAAYHHR